MAGRRGTEVADVEREVAAGPPSLAEVRSLVRLVDGGFCVPLVRRQLWRRWGLCHRHAWWLGAADCELCGEPRRTSIIYGELIERAVAQLHLPLMRPRRRLLGLRPTEPCVVCEETSRVSASTTAAPSWAIARCATIAALATTRALIDGTETEWAARTCPACLGGTGLLCREHVLAAPAKVQVPDLSAGLDEVQQRLQAFRRSMTWQGPQQTPALRASWVEAVGWLVGWPAPWRVDELPRDEQQWAG